MKPEVYVWGLLHDGLIVEVKGKLPDLSIRVEISYLRKMFSDDGDSIIVNLKGCSHFEYEIWDDYDKPIRTTNSLLEIQALQPEILYVKEEDFFVVIECNAGELKLKYEELELLLDTGVPISIFELQKANTKYWTRLKRRSSPIYRLIYRLVANLKKFFKK